MTASASTSTSTSTSASASCSGRLDPEHHVYVLFLPNGAEEILRCLELGASMAEAGREFRRVVCGEPMSGVRSRVEGRRESTESAVMEESAESAGMAMRFIRNRFLHCGAGNQDGDSSDPDCNDPSSDAAIHNSGIPAARYFPLRNHSSDVNNHAMDINSRNSSSKFLPLQGHSAYVYLDHDFYPRMAISACPISSKIDAKIYRKFRNRIYSFKDEYFNTIFDMCTLIRTDITQVVRYNSFDEYLGVPLQQTVSGTCALVSSTVCIEAQHRLEYEMVHGLGTFPCIAAAPRKLRNLCHRQFVQDQSTGERRRIWNIKKGAIVAEVLDQIMKLGGVRTTNGAPKPAPYLLPLRSWQHYKWEDGFTAYDVADLLDAHGPFIGNIWVCPWYDLFDSNVDDDLVYRSGCARSPGIQKRCEVVYGQHEKVGYHSVVCFEYRFCEGQMHEKILDNHAANGPRRWIHNDELTDVYIINVDRMDIRSGDIWYPNSWL